MKRIHERPRDPASEPLQAREECSGFGPAFRGRTERLGGGALPTRGTEIRRQRRCHSRARRSGRSRWRPIWKDFPDITETEEPKGDQTDRREGREGRYRVDRLVTGVTSSWPDRYRSIPTVSETTRRGQTVFEPGVYGACFLVSVITNAYHRRLFYVSASRAVRKHYSSRSQPPVSRNSTSRTSRILTRVQNSPGVKSPARRSCTNYHPVTESTLPPHSWTIVASCSSRSVSSGMYLASRLVHQ